MTVYWMAQSYPRKRRATAASQGMCAHDASWLVDCDVRVRVIECPPPGYCSMEEAPSEQASVDLLEASTAPAPPTMALHDDVRGVPPPPSPKPGLQVRLGRLLRHARHVLPYPLKVPH